MALSVMIATRTVLALLFSVGLTVCTSANAQTQQNIFTELEDRGLLDHSYTPLIEATTRLLASADRTMPSFDVNRKGNARFKIYTLRSEAIDATTIKKAPHSPAIHAAS